MAMYDAEKMKDFEPIPWSFFDIVKALNIRSDSDVYPFVKPEETCNCIFAGVSIDSRSIKKDEIFLALKGENFDGHDFISKLVEHGIKGFVVEADFFDHFVQIMEKNGNEKLEENKNKEKSRNKTQKQKRSLQGKVFLFKVDDTVKALGMLAKFQRIRSGVKLIAITGSNGKTSTRQMTTEIFRTRFNTLATMGNFNNEIGLPLTLLNLSKKYQWAIVEMGMNHRGELAGLSETAMPDIAIITNTAKAHLEGLGTVSEVAEAKAEIFSFVGKGGTAIINIDDRHWKILKKKAEENSGIDELIMTGTSDNAVIRAESIRLCKQKTCFTLVAENQKLKFDICMNTPAAFMVANALIAAAAAFKAGLSSMEIKKGLETFSPVPGRMTIMKSSKDFYIIDDTYNANPDSMKGALETLAELAGDSRSFAVLGDMLELGDQSEELHFETGRKAALSGVSRLYLYGNMAEHFALGAIKAGFARTKIMTGSKKDIVHDILFKGRKPAWILVKGSRGMKMEEVVADLI